MNSTTPSMQAVRITRRFAASPEQLYRAWLDPETVSRWMAPGGSEVTDAAVEERVGGRYSINQASGGERVGGFEGELLELIPNERIVLLWGFVGPEGLDGPRYDSQLTITFEPDTDGGTSLLLIHDRLDTLRAALPDVADSVQTGWQMVLDKLADRVDTDAR